MTQRHWARGSAPPARRTEPAVFQVLREMPAFDVTYTAVVISHSGRMMFVGTSVGTIRAMKYPLPLQKEFNEYQAHAGPVTKVRGTLWSGAQTQVSIEPPGPALHTPAASLQPPLIYPSNPMVRKHSPALKSLCLNDSREFSLRSNQIASRPFS